MAINTSPQGRFQRIKINKGIKKVLQERRLWNDDLRLDTAKKLLAEQSDFLDGVVCMENTQRAISCYSQYSMQTLQPKKQSFRNI